MDGLRVIINYKRVPDILVKRSIAGHTRGDVHELLCAHLFTKRIGEVFQRICTDLRMSTLFFVRAI